MTVSNYFKRIIGVVIFILFIFPLHSVAMPSNNPVAASFRYPSDSLADARTFAHIVQRVNEIQAMDKSNLSAGEKKALRKELLQLKHSADDLDSKIYISIGALIIIILLLILILR